MSEYQGLSFWLDSLLEAGLDTLKPRAPLSGNLKVDVAIIGSGLTGLWSAYYLLKQNPRLKVVVLEKEIAGFGASGRNGGWCSALFPASTGYMERKHGLQAALNMRQAMIDTVTEVGAVTKAEKLDCDFVQGGTVLFARSEPQLRRATEEFEEATHYGVDKVQWTALPTREPGSKTYKAVPKSPTGTIGKLIEPACARLHPGKLVRGLARVVEALGGEIFEKTEVLSWTRSSVLTANGAVEANHVVVATEGYGANFKQTHRAILPLYSLMIATEPLPDSAWSEIGIEHGQTFADFRHLLIYGQRTADNRFAFGGRGARYHWGSTIRSKYDKVPKVFQHLQDTLHEMFPKTREYSITHRWGGPLGVPRDWHAAVRIEDGVIWAGGYVGDGLSTTNIAGRTIADLVLGKSTKLTSLPWVNHKSHNWEPEPLRFVGANLGLTAMQIADFEERLTRRPSLAAKIMAPLVGG